MPVPSFDESTRANKISSEVLRWLSDASTYVRTTPDSAAEVYDLLKLVLRLLAVRNPESQSHAIRRALNNLIEGIYEQPNSEPVLLDLLGLLIRIVDAKQDYKYNAMKHLAISGLGSLAIYLRDHMRQMSANVFVVCAESLRIAPIEPRTRLYRNTILWALSESITNTTDEVLAKQVVKQAKATIEMAADDADDRTALVRAFYLLSAVSALPSAGFLSRRLEALNTLFIKQGASSDSPDVREAAAAFYANVLSVHSGNDFRHNIDNIIASIMKQAASPSKTSASETLFSYRYDGQCRLLRHLIAQRPASSEYVTDIDDWLAESLLRLEPAIAKSLLIDVIASQKLKNDHLRLDLIGALLRLLATSQEPVSLRSKLKSKVSKPLLASTLSSLSGAINLLGDAIQPIADPVSNATLGIILNGLDADNLSEEMIAYLIDSLVAVVRNVPTLLIPTISICLKQLEMEGAPAKRRKALAYVISAGMAESSKLALYSDVELTSRVFATGADLVKRRDDVASYGIAWILLSGVFTLGPKIVKPLVPQLLLLFESHLTLEVCDFPSSLERALTGLVVFMTHNNSLLTKDVSRRIGKILYGIWSGIEAKPVDLYVRRRLLQAYDLLLSVERSDIYPSSLLMKYIAHVTSPDSYSKESGVVIQSAISTAASRSSSPGGTGSSGQSEKLSISAIYEERNAVEAGLTDTGDRKTSYTNDMDCFLERTSLTDPLPIDVHSAVVKHAILVCSKLLALEPARIQESLYDAILLNLENSAGPRTLRKLAVVYNIADLLRKSLAYGVPLEERILRVVISMTRTLLENPDANVRNMSAESVGLLAHRISGVDHTGSALLTGYIKELVDSVALNTKDSATRNGFIIALGKIVRYRSDPVLLEAVFKITMPLIADPNADVHLAVLQAIKEILSTSDLVDQKYVRYALKSISLAYLLERNNDADCFLREVAEALALVVSRFGPGLSSEAQQVNLANIVRLATQLQSESSAHVRVSAWKSFIELYYYARQGVTWSFVIKRWRDIIVDEGKSQAETNAAVNGLLMLVRLSARSIFAIAGDGLEDALWLLLDREPENKEVRMIFMTWMEQTSVGSANVSLWVQRLNAVVMWPRYLFTERLGRDLKANQNNSNNNTSPEKAAAAMPSAVAADEDVSLSVQSDDSSNEKFSWEARAYALHLLHYLLHHDLKSKKTEERADSSSARNAGGIVKIAFAAATSQILGLQYAGLSLLNEIIVQLGDIADPDFPQISLLEQYQVQIISAIVPAFGRDSSPGLALAALRTCRTFLTSSIIKTKEKLGRIVKLLDDSLNSMDSKFRLGELDMTHDAAKVLKIGTLAVWAQVEIYAKVRTHLREVIEPRRASLIPYWVEAVREYGQLQASVDNEWSAISLLDSIEQVKAAQLRLLLQPVFKANWLVLVNALATLNDEDKESTGDDNVSFILCGLCFEALSETFQVGFVQQPTNTDQEMTSIQRGSDENVDASWLGDSQIDRYSILQVIDTVLVPTVSAQVVYGTEGYFDEVVPLLYRAMLVGSPMEQMTIVSIARNLVVGQAETDDSVDHLFEILKVAILPLRNLFPRLFGAHNAPSKATELGTEQIALLEHTLNALIDIAQVFREMIQNDLWVCLLKVFEEVNHYEAAVAAPSFKRLLEILSAQAEERGVAFIVDALTASLRRAVQAESTAESLVMCTAIVCTNFKSLFSPEALEQVREFGIRTVGALDAFNNQDVEPKLLEEANIGMQCILAVLRTCTGTPAGGAFAFATLPSLVELSVSATVSMGLRLQVTDILTIYALLEGTQSAFAFVVPTIVAVTRGPWQEEGNATARATRQLLQLMTRQPASFKQTVMLMDEADRAFLQQLLSQQVRAHDETGYESDAGDEEEDTGEITLTSFI